MFFKEKKNNNNENEDLISDFILNNNNNYEIPINLKTSNLIQSIKSFNLNIKNEFNLKSGDFFFISFDEIIFLIIESLKFHLKLIENEAKNYENILQNYLLFLRNKIIEFLNSEKNFNLKNYDLEKTISYKNIIEKLKEKTQLNTEINNNNNNLSVLNTTSKKNNNNNKKKFFNEKKKNQINNNNNNQTIKKNFSQKNLSNKKKSKFNNINNNNNNLTPRKKINLPVKKIFQYFQINNPPLTNRKENKSKHYFKFKKYIHNENLNTISAKKLEKIFNNSFSNSDNKYNNTFNLKTNRSFSRKPKPSSLANLYMQNGLNMVYEYKKIENKEKKSFGCF